MCDFLSFIVAYGEEGLFAVSEPGLSSHDAARTALEESGKPFTGYCEVEWTDDLSTYPVDKNLEVRANSDYRASQIKEWTLKQWPTRYKAIKHFASEVEIEALSFPISLVFSEDVARSFLYEAAQHLARALPSSPDRRIVLAAITKARKDPANAYDIVTKAYWATSAPYDRILTALRNDDNPMKHVAIEEALSRRAYNAQKKWQASKIKALLETL